MHRDARADIDRTCPSLCEPQTLWCRPGTSSPIQQASLPYLAVEPAAIESAANQSSSQPTLSSDRPNPQSWSGVGQALTALFAFLSPYDRWSCRGPHPVRPTGGVKQGPGEAGDDGLLTSPIFLRVRPDNFRARSPEIGMPQISHAKAGKCPSLLARSRGPTGGLRDRSQQAGSEACGGKDCRLGIAKPVLDICAPD